MKEQLEEIKLYLKHVFEIHSLWTVLINACLLGIGLAFVDISNIPSLMLGQGRYMCPVFLFIGLIVFSLFMRLHITQYRKINSINLYDFSLMTILGAACIYGVICSTAEVLVIYKLILMVVISVVVIVLIRERQRDYVRRYKLSDEYCENIVDLKDLYEDNVRIDGPMFFIDETDVDYDLLKRDTFINYVYNVVCNCKPKGSFVISLEGPWGSGKTTILKNVKRLIEENEEQIAVIDDFDPWVYGNEQALVEGLLNCLLQNDKIEVQPIELDRSVDVLANAIVSIDERAGLLKYAFLHEKSLEECKKQINEYLRLSEKRIVFFIDNLDRVEQEKIILLFKLIGNVLNFDRVVYVLSYDPDKVSKILESDLNVGYKYLEKIVQLQIRVPELEEERKNYVIRTCTQNLLKKYEVEDSELKDYGTFMEILCSKINNLREYKRLVNSVLVKVLSNRLSLSKRDMLVIQYIKVECPALYSEIYNNSKYYISEGRMYNQELYVSVIREEKNHLKPQEYFKQLFENAEYCSYQKLLASIFPNVFKSLDKLSILDVQELNAKEIEKSRGIASAKYFPLYFCETENEYSLLGACVQQFIKKQESNLVNMNKDLRKIFKDFSVYHQGEILSLIQLYLSEWSSKTLVALIRVLIDMYWEIDDSIEFFSSSARRRTSIVIWEAMQRIDEESFQQVIKGLEKSYDLLEMINTVSHWFEKDSSGINQAGRKNEWQQLENKLVAEILNNKINLYDDPYYHRHNIWGMLRNMKDDEARFKAYIATVISPKNVFRLLADMIGCSVGREYRYYYTEETINYFIDVDSLDKLLKNAVSHSEDEKFMKGLYEMCMNNREDISEERGILCETERKFDVL